MVWISKDCLLGLIEGGRQRGKYVDGIRKTVGAGKIDEVVN